MMPGSLCVSRLLIAGAGSVAVALLPSWVVWLRATCNVELRIALTHRAGQLVSRAALGALTGHAVAVDTDDPDRLAQVPHQELAAWPDAILVAPATANLVARLAQGDATCLLTTTLLATTAPVVLAPAMTPAMAAKPAVRRNLRQIADDGYGVVPTGEGLSAFDGRLADGAMADAPTAIAYLDRFLRAEQEAAA